MGARSRMLVDTPTYLDERPSASARRTISPYLIDARSSRESRERRIWPRHRLHYAAPRLFLPPTSRGLQMELRPAVAAACATCAVAVTGAVASASSARNKSVTTRATSARASAGLISPLPTAIASAQAAIVRPTESLGTTASAVPSLRVAVLGLSGWRLRFPAASAGVNWDRVDVGNGSNLRHVRIRGPGAHPRHGARSP